MKACDISRSPSRTSSPLSLLLWCWFSFLSSPSLFHSPVCAHYSTTMTPPTFPPNPVRAAFFFILSISTNSLSCLCPLLFHYNHRDGSNVKKWKSEGLFPPPVSFCHRCLWSLTHSSLQLCLLMVSLSTSAFTHASLEELWSPPTFVCSITEPQDFDKASNTLRKTCFFILPLFNISPQVASLMRGF